MARASRHGALPLALAALFALALIIVVIKWLLITAAILAVPFGLWWLYDRTKRSSGGRPVS